MVSKAWAHAAEARPCRRGRLRGARTLDRNERVARPHGGGALDHLPGPQILAYVVLWICMPPD